MPRLGQGLSRKRVICHGLQDSEGDKSIQKAFLLVLLSHSLLGIIISSSSDNWLEVNHGLCTEQG